MPGATAFTRTPLGATSRAAACVNMRTVAFEASYTTIGPVDAVNDEVDATFTMLPVPRGTIARRPACIAKNRPRALTDISRS